jgi:Na+(H+)/acetate symporter ActP
LFIFSILIGVSANLLGANAAVNEAGLAIANYLPEISKEQHTELVIQFIKLLGNSSPWLVGFLAVCAIASLQATATSFMSTTGNILSRDIYVHYFDKNSNHKKQLGAARLFTGLVFLCGMLLASFSMEATLLLGSLAIACSFQLWPSLLGATWLSWITRGGATAGLSIGLIAVILTEPIGQKLTGGSLPWGVWPWNVHSAVWGMFFNIVICIIVSFMASNDSEKNHRQTFHNFFKKHSEIKPGSVFGNMAFGEPNIGFDKWILGMPSIWAWQIIWWALGVGAVWFLANKLRMSVEPEIEIKSITSD